MWFFALFCVKGTAAFFWRSSTFEGYSKEAQCCHFASGLLWSPFRQVVRSYTGSVVSTTDSRVMVAPASGAAKTLSSPYAYSARGTRRTRERSVGAPWAEVSVKEGEEGEIALPCFIASRICEDVFPCCCSWESTTGKYRICF